MKIKDSVIRITDAFKKYKNTIFNKNNYNLEKFVCIITLVLSILIVSIGFTSTIFTYYIGDTLLRIFLLFLGLLLIYQIVYSYKKLKQRGKIITMSIFTIIVLILAYLLPMFPPYYSLRTFDVNAAFLKFFIDSIFLIIIGILSVKYTMKALYKFTSKAEQASAYFILIFSIILILYPLIVVIGNIISNGMGAITWGFLTEDVSRHGTKGGVFPGIIGTLLLMMGTAIIALPLGISCAIYLNEYAKPGTITRILRISADILQGVPSIVFGLFGLAVFIPLFGRCLFTGILILAFMTLPIIIRTSEEALMSVPKELREGSYALGGTRWQTIRRVVLPPATSGIITGAVLGIGRAAGETAPIMFTATYFSGAGIPTSIFDPIQALPTHLLQLTYFYPAYDVLQNAWGTAFLLIAIVLGMNAISIIIREKYRVEF